MSELPYALARRLGAFDAAMIVMGRMVGAGIFVFRRRAGALPRISLPGHPLTTLVFIAACLFVAGSTWVRYPGNSAAGLGILLSGVPAWLIWTRAR